MPRDATIGFQDTAGKVQEQAKRRERDMALVMQGLLRRGMQVEALRDFILTQGASKNITYQEWDKIWTFNKKIIDPVCPRHTAVKSEGKSNRLYTARFLDRGRD